MPPISTAVEPNRRLGFFYALAVFVAGILVAVLLVHPCREARQREQSMAAARWSAAQRDTYVAVLDRELALNPSQRQQVGQVLDETMRQDQDMRSFLASIQLEGISRLRAMLDDRQRERFDRMMKETRAAANPPRAR